MRILLVLVAAALALAVWLLGSTDSVAPPSEDPDAPADATVRDPGPVLVAPDHAGDDRGGNPVRGEDRVHGVVAHLDGQRPAAGVVVVAQERPSARGYEQIARAFSLEPAADHRVQADAAGRFSFEALVADKDYRIFAAPAAPLVSTAAHVRPQKQVGPVRLFLRTGTPLFGRVVDESGAGLRASVSCYETYGHPRFHLHVSSDARGHFRFPAVPAGTVNIDVRVEGLGAVEGIDAHIPRTEPLIVSFLGGATVRGTVRDTTGRPVPTAVARGTVYHRQESHQRVARVQPDGTFLLPGLPSGELWGLEVAAPSYVTRKNIGDGWPLAPGSVTPFDVTLVRGATIEGRVLTPEGEPLADALVAWRRMADQAFLYDLQYGAARSQADGRFRLEGLAPAGAGTLFALAYGYCQREKMSQGPLDPTDEGPLGQMVSLDEEGAVVTADIVLRPGVPLHGTLKMADGAPVADARIDVRTSDEGTLYAWDEVTFAEAPTTDAHGAFVHPGLPPGSSWSLRGQRAPWVGPAETVKVPMGATSLPPLSLTLVPAGSVRGLVVEERGTPVAGVAISTSDSRAVTDAKGNFHLQGLPPGTHKFSLHAKGHSLVSPADATATVVAGEETPHVTLVARAQSWISGTVVGAGGSPVPRCEVTLEITDPERTESTRRTDRQGAFRFEVPPRGVFLLSTAQMKEARTLYAPQADIELPGASQADHALVLHFIGPNGQEVVGGEVIVWKEWEDGNMGSHVEVSNGWLRQTVAPPFDKISVSVESLTDVLGRPIAFVRKSFPIDPTQTGPVEVRVEAGRQITGVVIDEAGAGIANATVGARSVEDDDNWLIINEGRRVMTDAEGAFRIGGLRLGAQKLFVSPPAPYAKSGAVLVAGDGPVRIVLSAASTVGGSVVDPSGVAVPRVRVSASDDFDSLGTTSDAEGRFTISGVHPTRLLTVSASSVERDGRDLRGTSAERIAPGRDDVVLRMLPGARIGGRVVTEDGSPLPGTCTVTIEQEGKASSTLFVGPGPGGTTATFRSEVMAPGTYQVTVRYNDGDWGKSPPIEVRAPKEDVKLVLPKGYPIQGTIEGVRAPGFLVAAIVDGKALVSRRVSADGSFVLPMDTSQAVTLFATKPGDARYLLATDVKGRTTATYTMQEGGAIEGRIVGVSTERIQRVHAARGTLPKPEALVVSAKVQPDGSFRLSGVPPGEWTVYVQGDKVEVKSGVASGTAGLELGPRAPDAPEADLPDPPSGCGTSQGCGCGGGSCG